MNFEELNRLFGIVEIVSSRIFKIREENKIPDEDKEEVTKTVTKIREMVLADIYEGDDLCITKELIDAYKENGFILDINKQIGQIVNIDNEYSIVITNKAGIGIVITKVTLNEMKVK